VPDLVRQHGLVTEGLSGRMRHLRYVQVSLAMLSYTLIANYLALYVVFALWLLILFLIVRLEGGELRRRSFSRPGSAITIMFQSSMALPRDLPTPRQSNVGPYQTTWGQPSSSSPHLQGNVATTSHRVIPGTLHAGE
jgi:hypothetical protein